MPRFQDGRAHQAARYNFGRDDNRLVVAAVGLTGGIYNVLERIAPDAGPQAVPTDNPLHWLNLLLNCRADLPIQDDYTRRFFPLDFGPEPEVEV